MPQHELKVSRADMWTRFPHDNTASDTLSSKKPYRDTWERASHVGYPVGLLVLGHLAVVTFVIKSWPAVCSFFIVCNGDYLLWLVTVSG